MKEYMFKIVVERPRIKDRHSKPSNEHRKTDIEDLPLKESMKRPHRKDSKTLNENLAPLERFLAKNVNRPWDKVYSEISERISVKSAVQQHVRDHLKDFVVFPAIENGKYVIIGGYGGSTPIEESYRPFYVDKHGLLKKVKKVKRKRYSWKDRPKDDSILEVDPELMFKRMSGTWFRILSRKFEGPLTEKIEVKDIVSSKTVSKIVPTPTGMILDALLKMRLFTFADKAYLKKSHYAYKIEQANSRDLKKHGLVNFERVHAIGCPCKSNKPKKGSYTFTALEKEITCDKCRKLR